MSATIRYESYQADATAPQSAWRVAAICADGSTIVLLEYSGQNAASAAADTARELNRLDPNESLKAGWLLMRRASRLANWPNKSFAAPPRRPQPAEGAASAPGGCAKRPAGAQAADGSAEAGEKAYNEANR